MINTARLRRDFPILKRTINGKPLTYLDNAATTQKPRQVIEAISHYYQKYNANVHRGVHTLSLEATEAYEAARAKVAKLVGVDSAGIIFVRNATEAINLVAYSWGRLNIERGDEIVLSIAEHHSNFVVWQQLARENGAILKVVPIRQVFDSEVAQVVQILRNLQTRRTQGAQGRRGLRPIDENGEIDLLAFKRALTKKTKLVTFFHVSNVLGTINDVHSLSAIVHRQSPKAKILVDGAQAVPHMPVNIKKLGCDFYVFTGHKMLGPTGIGVLWGRRELLESMPPFLFGGEMISKVRLHEALWNELPWKFEAGTPDIAGAIGLAAAVDYLQALGMDNIRKHEIELTEYALKRLSKIPEVVIYGSLDANKRGGVVSFNIGSPSTHSINSGSSTRFVRSGSMIHAHDVASILDSEGIAIRSGHHCAQPLMEFLGLQSAARASFYIYNTREEVDRLVEGIEKVKKEFKL